MPGRLQGKIAVVTGSNSGIGRGVALAYGREGATVVCASRHEASKADGDDGSTHDIIGHDGGNSVFIKLEFSQTDSISDLVRQVVDKYERIDVWVNVAGTIGKSGPIWQLTDEEFDESIDINLKGTFKCTRAAAAQMVKQEPDSSGLRGRIINIDSVFGPRGFAQTASYSASKSGLMGMARAAAVDLAPHKVTINTICPGTVTTPATSNLPAPMREALEQKSLLGFGKPEDIAGPAVMLASDDGKWVHGAELFIDGGYCVA